MIYLVTNQPELFPDQQIYQLATLADCIGYLVTLPIIALDVETTGFDCHGCRLISLQVGNRFDQYVIDTGSVDIYPLKEVLEKTLLIGQNIKFDLKFLYKKKIYPRRVYDTFIAERILFCGLIDHKAGLDSLAINRLGLIREKTIRSRIATEGLSSRVIKYGAMDIDLLEDIRDQQLIELKEKDMMGVLSLENRYIPCLAYIEYCGFKLDVARWKAKMKLDNDRLELAEQRLNNWIMEHGMGKYFTPQLSLFEQASCKINWSSSYQVVELFTELGMSCVTKVKGELKKSVDINVISKYADSYPIVPIYIAYKNAFKDASTWGQNWIDQISPVTGRVHTNFTQIMDTGRISSGGKDKNTGEKYPNFQNIPSDPVTRCCFVPAAGNKLTIADYSGQEQVILANVSLDPVLLEFYDSGMSDMHCFVASKIYPELQGLTVEQIKALHPEKRQNAKAAGFAIIFGGDGSTIAGNLKISLVAGEAIYNSYFEAFPGLKDYFDKAKQQGLKNGYIFISHITRRKSYLGFFQRYKDLEATLNGGLWKKYREAKLHDTPEFPALRELVVDFFNYQGVIERCSLNYPIQGRAAEVTKISATYIFDYIVENELVDIVLFCNTVHDEHILEQPAHMSEDIAHMTRRVMEKAGDIYCKRVPLKAVPVTALEWKK